ncbi:DUF3592 domain-containing protein [Granulosicoccus sp. 3-233]|uniref:DUF3592 domain-containing protein n=1 Tax=Granulosicoccus sp. 3-233 TaxID=3417969 RepID=UPI003D32F35B
MNALVNELAAFCSRIMEGERQSIFLLISMYCFLMLGYSALHQIRMRRWPSTIGHLATIGKKVFEVHTGRSETSYRLNALYEYGVNGRTYQGNRVSAWIVIASRNAKGVLDWQSRGVELLGDDQVRVFYNPGKPSKSVLIRPGQVGLAVTAFGALLPLGLHLFHYYI